MGENSSWYICDRNWTGDHFLLRREIIFRDLHLMPSHQQHLRLGQITFRLQILKKALENLN